MPTRKPPPAPGAPAPRKRAPAIQRSRLPAAHGGIEVNFCKNPACANYGVPIPPTAPRGQGKGSGGPYRLSNKAKTDGGVEVDCSVCGEVFPLKSNRGIAEELERLRRPLAALAEPCCSDTTCPNHEVPVGTPGAYIAFGRNRSGNPRWRCKACGRTLTRKARATTGQRVHKTRTLGLFKALVGRTPLARIADMLGVDAGFVQRRIRFIHEQCVAFAADRERRLAEMEIPRLYVSMDAQEHTVNWTDHKDRRNVQLVAVASVDNATGYCLGMHLNFDEALDPVAVEADVLATSDRADPIPLRRHARLWLADDYADQKVRIAAKARASAAAAAVLVGLQAEIAGAYAEQQARDDVENADHPTPTQRLPERGMLTRRDYTLYAHFAYLRALCPKVGKWRFFLDQDPGMRAACLATFVQEVKAKTCDAWYVRISKGLTMGKKRKLTETARKAFVAAKLRMPAGTTDHQVVVALIRAKMAAMVPMGRWHDKWLDHPMPNMSEPEKAAAWLTEDPALDPDHAASLYNLASLHGADSLFNRVRRRVSLLERSPVTSSGRVWTAYAPYVPEQAARLIEIVRVCHNFVWTDDKGTTTPAMRLGLAKGPVGFDDILRFVP